MLLKVVKAEFLENHIQTGFYKIFEKIGLNLLFSKYEFGNGTLSDAWLITLIKFPQKFKKKTFLKSG